MGLDYQKEGLMTLFDIYTEEEISQWKVNFKNEYGAAEIYPKDMYLYRYSYEYEDGCSFACIREPVKCIFLFVPDYIYGVPSKYDVKDLSQYEVSSYKIKHAVRGLYEFYTSSFGIVLNRNSDQSGSKRKIIYWSPSIVPDEEIKDIFQDYIDEKYDEQYKKYKIEKIKRNNFSKVKNQLQYLFPRAEGSNVERIF